MTKPDSVWFVAKKNICRKKVFFFFKCAGFTLLSLFCWNELKKPIKWCLKKKGGESEIITKLTKCFNNLTKCFTWNCVSFKVVNSSTKTKSAQYKFVGPSFVSKEMQIQL